MVRFHPLEAAGSGKASGLFLLTEPFRWAHISIFLQEETMKPQDIATNDLGIKRARLAFLASTLRNLKTDFPDHTWDFTAVERNRECGTCGCAAGVAQMLWPAAWDALMDNPSTSYYWGCMGEMLGISMDSAEYIFASRGDHRESRDVTPEEVADRIDAVMAAGL
jgi:hypothetical protein